MYVVVEIDSCWQNFAKTDMAFKMAAEFWQNEMFRCSKACLRGSRIAVKLLFRMWLFYLKTSQVTFPVVYKQMWFLWLSVAFCGWAVQPWFSNTCCFSGSWLLHLWTNCFFSVWTQIHFWVKLKFADRNFFKSLFWFSIRMSEVVNYCLYEVMWYNMCQLHAHIIMQIL